MLSQFIFFASALMMLFGSFLISLAFHPKFWVLPRRLQLSALSNAAMALMFIAAVFSAHLTVYLATVVLYLLCRHRYVQEQKKAKA